MRNDFLTVKEARAAFSTLLRSEKALRRLVDQGRVHVYRVGKRMLFDRARLSRELERLLVEPTAVGGARVATEVEPVPGPDGWCHTKLGKILAGAR